MSGTTVAYEWVCPICGIKRLSLTDRGRSAIEAQAENAIRSHVENSNGSGHGAVGEVPEGFADTEVASHIRVKTRVGGQTAPKVGQ